MRHIAATMTEARWVWISTFDGERAAVFPPFQMGQSHWRNDDVLAIGDFIRRQPEPVVDLQAEDPGGEGRQA